MTNLDNIKLVLKTDTQEYGNSSGQQIDTLSMAVFGSDYNDIIENSLDWIHDHKEYALKEYDYESDFLATLSSKQARIYIENPESYKSALATFTKELQEKARSYELDEQHPLANAIEEARDSAETQIYKEWLYGSYQESGLLKDASKKYGVAFHYDEKTDTLSCDIEADELADLVEYKGVKPNAKAVGAYLASDIESDAHASIEKTRARNAEYRKERENRNRIKAEREAEAEAKRIEKLLAIK